MNNGKKLHWIQRYWGFITSKYIITMKSNETGSYSLSSDFAFAAVSLNEIMTLPVLSPKAMVSKIKNNQIVVSSKNLLKFKSTGELQKSSESKSNKEYCVPITTSEYKSTGELQESSESKSNEENNDFCHNLARHYCNFHMVKLVKIYAQGFTIE